MKKGAVNEATDFAAGTIIFIMLFVFLSIVSSCVKGNKEDAVKAPISSLKSSEELMVLLQVPITFQGEKMTFSDLLRRYYSYEASGNDNEKGRIKEFLKDYLKDFTSRGAGDYAKQKICWEFKLFAENDELLGISGDDCNGEDKLNHVSCLKPAVDIVPMYPGYEKKYLVVAYSSFVLLDDKFSPKYKSLDPLVCS